MLKTIHLCADDFGLTPGIDASILALAGDGRLSATSCMSTGPRFARDAQSLLELPVHTGLHLNLTEPFEAHRFYQPLSALLRNSYLHRVDGERLTLEITRQLDAFENALGRAPDYVDGHQHVHQFPLIRERLIEILLRRYPGHRPWLRATAPGRLGGLPWRDRFKAHCIAWLGARKLARLARRSGFAQNRRLLGVYGFSGGTRAYRDWLGIWLANAEAGDLLMCHPAESGDPSDGIGTQREAEHRVLASADLPALLQRYGLTLAARDSALNAQGLG